MPASTTPVRPTPEPRCSEGNDNATPSTSTPSLVQHSFEKPRKDLGLPQLPLNPSAHRLNIAATCIGIFLNNGGLFLVLYFTLVYASSAPLQVVLAVPSATFVLANALQAIRRLYLMLACDDEYRPLSASAAYLDHTHLQIHLATLYIIPLLVVGIVIAPDNPLTAIQLISLPLPIFLIQVSAQLLITAAAVSLKLRYPIRVSSSRRGALIRPLTFSIVEDVGAVDCRAGKEWRTRLAERYAASAEIRALFRRLDIVWGISCMTIAVIAIAVIFGVGWEDLSIVMGWGVPWMWAAVSALWTWGMTKSALEKEALAGVFILDG